MDKALELISTLIDGANEYEKKTGNTNPTVYLSKNNLLIIQQALQRLESIDNSNPSEAFKIVYNNFDYLISDVCIENDDVNICLKTIKEQLPTIKQALLKAQKEHKALEIIKEKDCDVSWLKYCIKGNLIVEAYNSGYPEYHNKLTEEEFNLLRSVLE